MSGNDASARFWWANLALWLAYLLINLVLASNYANWSGGVVMIFVLLSASLYLVSGGIRHLAQRHGWLDLELGALCWRMLSCVLAGAALTQIAIAVMLRTLLMLGWASLPDGGDFSMGASFGYWINTAIMLGLWVAGWIGWRALRHAREARAARIHAESERQQMQQDALRARLNPHFVFNALNNLRALILEDPQRARELVGRLSNTLRHALGHTRRDAVPLSEEVAVVEDYLAIESVHFEDRLRVRRDIDPATHEAMLPPMALQLLVENAIKHGIAVTPGGGELLIRAESLPGLLRLTVENPGTVGRGGDGHGVGLAYLRHVLVHVDGRFALEQADETVRATLDIPQ
ncbi:histidine kinase [Xanthomonadaceae bacterium JHOS43]|nr:histidine kinase [Xanthomonadaceae bacterium JHOS43]